MEKANTEQARCNVTVLGEHGIGKHGIGKQQ